MTSPRVETTFGQLLAPERIVVPLKGSDLKEAVGELHACVVASVPQVGVDYGTLLERLGTGEGAVVRPEGEAVLVLGLRSPGLEHPVAALGVRRSGLEPVEPLSHLESGIRVVLLVFSPGTLAGLRRQTAPRAAFRLGSDNVLPELLGADSPAAVMEISQLMDAAIDGQLRVQDVMGPAPYRVFPDTPLLEVLELTARRQLAAVPVVGEDFEVLGIITESDLIKHLLPVWMAAEEEEKDGKEISARDIMARAVLCVSEEGALAEAAVLMMNRGVAQMPVVRDGRLVGMLERRTVLAALSERLIPN